MSEIHQNLLSQMLLDKAVYFSAAMPEACFPEGKLRTVYRAISKRLESGQGLDTILLSQDVPEIPRAELVELTSTVPSAANWRYYADEIKREWRREQVRVLGLELQERWRDDTAAEFAYERLSHIADSGAAEIRTAPAMVQSFIPVVEERYKNRGRLPGIATGMPKLDSMLLGLQKRRLIYVGARPSAGKTALITSLIANVCRQGIACGFLSLESSHHEIMARIFSNVGNINNQNLVTGHMEVSFSKVGDVAEEVNGWPLFMSDKENMDLGTIRAKAREMVRAHGVRVLFLDYIQLVPQTDKMQQYRLHMNEVSLTFKQIARELEVPFVVAAQLGRAAQDKEPTLADFKETGQIEQDADVALLIHHDDGSRLIVAKNKDGPTGYVPVDFVREKMRFAEA